MNNRYGYYFVLLSLYTLTISLWLHIFPKNFASVTALLCFSAVIASALLISWAAEAAEFSISQGLAVAIVALLQVVPEFMVEAVIAWHREIDLMMANMTGSNRLLMGVGWPLIFVTSYVYSLAKDRKTISSIRLRPENIVEVIALFVSSMYFIIVLIKRSLEIYDGIFLGIVFICYVFVLRILPEEEEEKKQDLLSMPRYVVSLKKKIRGPAIAMLFVIGGVTMWAVADPFLLSMKEVSVGLGISAFVFVQWVAPFLSEFPEKVTAFYWAKTIRLAPMALLNMISSKVNQWTLLVSMIPIIYSFSMGRVSTIPLDLHHREEILLSMVMTFYGCIALAKLRFTKENAAILFVLWLAQFIFPVNFTFLPKLPVLGNSSRLITSSLFIILSIYEIIRHKKEFKLLLGIKETVRLARSKNQKANHKLTGIA
jgi:cation:H+ antiporter